MNADRPDQTEETSVVEKGQFQWESGILFNDLDTGRSALIKRIVIRYGITKKLEVGLLIE